MSDKFEFIDVEHAANTTNTANTGPGLPIVKMCVLLEVSRSGFYEWRDRPASATAGRREELKQFIVKSFTDSDGTYGYRRVHADLAGWDVRCGPELVRCLMRELGLEPCQPRPWRFCLTDNDGQTHHIPDLVQRDFTADAPGLKLVGDVTYIDTWEGWVYLATVIDCHTKAVVGWAMDDNYKTPLIEKAIAMAARDHRLADNAIFHSDRGSNGGFMWSSQHLDDGGVLRWQDADSCAPIERSGRLCGRRGGHRLGGASNGSFGGA